jgi:hypothetical protein
MIKLLYAIPLLPLIWLAPKIDVPTIIDLSVLYYMIYAICEGTAIKRK